MNWDKHAIIQHIFFMFGSFFLLIRNEKKRNVNNKIWEQWVHHFLEHFHSNWLKHGIMKMHNQLWDSLVMRNKCKGNGHFNPNTNYIRFQDFFFSLCDIYAFVTIAIEYRMKNAMIVNVSFSISLFLSLFPLLAVIIRFIAVFCVISLHWNQHSHIYTKDKWNCYAESQDRANEIQVELMKEAKFFSIENHHISIVLIP